MDLTELDDIRTLLNQLGKQAVIRDFEEHVQLKSVRESLRAWRKGRHLAAFAYVDDFANLWFEIAPGFSDQNMEAEIVGWGKQIQTQRNHQTGENGTLDATCEANDKARISMLMRNGFDKQSVRSLQYEKVLTSPVDQFRFPDGYT